MTHESEAFRVGYERGQAAGSWVIDGNTSEKTARHILNGIEEGDPVVLDMAPAPLSGEWAGESIPELSDLYGIDLSDETNAEDFEQGFGDGYWQEVERSARAMLPEPEEREPLNVYQLALLAEVASPDAIDSPASQWLEHVQVVARGLLSENAGLDADEFSDLITEAADESVPVYTHERWEVFVDLAAYQEDVSDFGPIQDMEQGAGVALYLVAERLIRAIVEDVTT